MHSSLTLLLKLALESYHVYKDMLSPANGDRVGTLDEYDLVDIPL